MITCILGKTASGKNMVSKLLVNNYGYKRIITYTTRPIRKGEIDGETYHYISDEEFKKKMEENFFIEYQSYVTEHGIWYYGTAQSDVDTVKDREEEYLLIVTPSGLKKIEEKLGYSLKSVYIYSNNKTIKERLISRGDDKNEAVRRIQQDNIDFKGIEVLVDRIVYNNIGKEIDVVAKIINHFIREEHK